MKTIMRTAIIIIILSILTGCDSMKKHLKTKEKNCWAEACFQK
jgi:uncharacterized protein YceK